MSLCIIINVSDMHVNWSPGPADSQRIPVGDRPTVVQPTREAADAEAKRLAAADPSSSYVVFEAQAVTQLVEIATRKVPTLASIADMPSGDDIPF